MQSPKQFARLPENSKNLLKDLVYFVLVGPKGLKIQFRLKHAELSKDVTRTELIAAKENECNVIDLEEKRQANASVTVADAEPPGSDPRFNNLGITGSQVVGFGRSQASVFEPSQLVVRRIYRVQWKKPIINQDELAKLYWEDGLTMGEIAKIFAVGRTTVRDRLCKLKVIHGKRRVNGLSH